MPLNQSDRALLQLFLEGGQDYARAAVLLGVSEDDVAARARSALGALVEADAPIPDPVADWLLGQADPITEADAVSSVRAEPDLRRRTVAAASGLRLLFPSAEIPEVPEAPEGSSPPPQTWTPGPSRSPQEDAPTVEPRPVEPPKYSSPPGSPHPSGSSGPSISSRIATGVGGLSSALSRNPRAAVLAGAASFLVIAVVLGITLLGGEDAKKSVGDKGTATLVPLAPSAGDGRGSGQAVVVARNGAAIVQVSIRGLAPTGSGQSYVLWLYRNPEQAYPLARDVVSGNGKLTGPAPVPRNLDPPYGSYGCLELTLASRSEIERGLKEVARSGSGPAVGSSVLRGEIAPASRDPRSGSASVCDPETRDS